MPRDPEDGKGLIAAWHTNHRVTVYLLENLPSELWSQSVPGSPRRTVRMIAAHIHNARCMWIKMLGARHRIPVPRTVDGRAGPSARAPPRAVAEQRRHHAVDPARCCSWRCGSPGGVAELSYRSPAFSQLLRGARGSPSWAAGHAGAAIGAPPAFERHRRTLAVDQASARMTSWSACSTTAPSPRIHFASMLSPLCPPLHRISSESPSRSGAVRRELVSAGWSDLAVSKSKPSCCLRNGVFPQPCTRHSGLCFGH